ncbi:hypothetical protein B0O95_10926 [Mycetohabitans endofungorum]|uniref:Uncharacterized protein n=1 Tax=Mycetohabitans endofungorum TaxID=417203 RepID=A0A2P5K910_9BURK|nr:hypothetical protein B0O95_10926 [Mycetohabitans endofungorum]
METKLEGGQLGAGAKRMRGCPKPSLYGSGPMAERIGSVVAWPPHTELP